MKAISFLFILGFIISCSTPEVKEKDPIKAALNTKNDEYRECFLESDSYKGRRAPETTAVIQVSFTINAKGTATNSKVYESPFKDANLHACVLGMIRLIHFPLPKEGETTDVKETISFKPRT